jgi:hypothetical protein
MFSIISIKDRPGTPFSVNALSLTCFKTFRSITHPKPRVSKKMIASSACAIEKSTSVGCARLPRAAGQRRFPGYRQPAGAVLPISPKPLADFNRSASGLTADEGVRYIAARIQRRMTDQYGHHPHQRQHRFN